MPKKKVHKNKNKILIISLIATLIIIVAAILIFIVLAPEKINCTKLLKDDGILMESKINMKVRGTKIKNVIVNKEIKILNQDEKIDYLDAVRTSLEDRYKRENIKYKIDKKNDKLFIELIYNDDKEYILDDLFININDTGISINFISDDIENNYIKLNLKRQYKKENIIKIIEKADYKCK